MLSYCLKCRKNAESKNPKFAKTKNRRMMFSSNCAVRCCKQLRFIKDEEVKGLLSMFGKIPLLGRLLI